MRYFTWKLELVSDTMWMIARGFYLVWFQKSEMKWKKNQMKKELQEKIRNENEQDGNKMKTKWKQKQNKQNKKVKK